MLRAISVSVLPVLMERGLKERVAREVRPPTQSNGPARPRSPATHSSAVCPARPKYTGTRAARALPDPAYPSVGSTAPAGRRPVATACLSRRGATANTITSECKHMFCARASSAQARMQVVPPAETSPVMTPRQAGFKLGGAWQDLYLTSDTSRRYHK